MNTESIQAESILESSGKSTACSSRSAGRWTKEEHQKFVEALKLYGKNWKNVEEFIGTRTGAQIRSHAQKFFNRLQRELGIENTTSSNLTSIAVTNHHQTTPNTNNLRKYSASSISTNNSINSGNHSDEDDKDCKSNTNEGISSLMHQTHHPIRKINEDIRGPVCNITEVPSGNSGHGHHVQKMTLQIINPKEGKLRHGSFYEAIMDRFRQSQKDGSFTLKLSDLVDMRTHHHHHHMMETKPSSRNAARISSFRPAGTFRRGSFACYGGLYAEEPPILKRIKLDEDF